MVADPWPAGAPTSFEPQSRGPDQRGGCMRVLTPSTHSSSLHLGQKGLSGAIYLVLSLVP